MEENKMKKNKIALKVKGKTHKQKPIINAK